MCRKFSHTNELLAIREANDVFSHVKKMICPIRIANDVFWHVRKMIQKPQRWVCFAPSFPPSMGACSVLALRVALQSFNDEICWVHKGELFERLEKWTIVRKLEYWIALYTSLPLKRIVESLRNNSTNWKKVGFSCTFNASYFVLW